MAIHPVNPLEKEDKSMRFITKNSLACHSPTNTICSEKKIKKRSNLITGGAFLFYALAILGWCAGPPVKLLDQALPFLATLSH
jgi:hypothetical protein